MSVFHHFLLVLFGLLSGKIIVVIFINFIFAHYINKKLHCRVFLWYSFLAVSGWTNLISFIILGFVDWSKNGLHGFIEKLEISQLFFTSTFDVARIGLFRDQNIQKLHNFRSIVGWFFQYEVNTAFHDQIMLIISQVIDLVYQGFQRFVGLCVFCQGVFYLHVS